MKPSMNITKLDAAKRQLESALLLYFNYCDPVSIHTLCAAAYNILRDVNAKRGGELMVKDMWQYLDAEKAKEFHRHVNMAENFFKHADRDSDGMYTFNPEGTEALLAEASRKYIEMTGEYPPYRHVFLTWFVVEHRNMFKEHPPIAQILDSVKLTAIPSDRKQFFASLLPLIAQFRTS